MKRDLFVSLPPIAEHEQERDLLSQDIIQIIIDNVLPSVGIRIAQTLSCTDVCNKKYIEKHHRRYVVDFPRIQKHLLLLAVNQRACKRVFSIDELECKWPKLISAPSGLGPDYRGPGPVFPRDRFKGWGSDDKRRTTIIMECTFTVEYVARVMPPGCPISHRKGKEQKDIAFILVKPDKREYANLDPEERGQHLYYARWKFYCIEKQSTNEDVWIHSNLFYTVPHLGGRMREALGMLASLCENKTVYANCLWTRDNDNSFSDDDDDYVVNYGTRCQCLAPAFNAPCLLNMTSYFLGRETDEDEFFVDGFRNLERKTPTSSLCTNGMHYEVEEETLCKIYIQMKDSL